MQICTLLYIACTLILVLVIKWSERKPLRSDKSNKIHNKCIEHINGGKFVGIWYIEWIKKVWVDGIFFGTINEPISHHVNWPGDRFQCSLMDHHPVITVINSRPKRTHPKDNQSDKLWPINVPVSNFNCRTNMRSELLLDATQSIRQYILLDWIICPLTSPSRLQYHKSNRRV